MTARWIAILGLSICALAVSGEAEAQAYPAACKPAPGGYADCRSKIPSPYWFYGGGCGNAGYYSSGGAAQSAYESLDKPFVGGGCTVTTWNDKGLLASHANVPRASFSFGCPTGDNYLVPNYTDGLEIENYRRYSIAYGINPPACDVLRQPYDQATYGQFRSVYCPRGTTNFFSACARQTIEVEKNLGKQCPSCGNPISPGIGNKFQEEVDYAGVAGSPLKFVRFYNSSQAPKLRRNTHFSYSMIYDLFGQDVFSFYSSNQAQSSFWNRRAMQSIGGNWTHNYMRSISVMTSTNENGSTPATEGLTTAYVYRGDGRMLAFNKYLGQWVGDADVIDTLADGPSGSLVYYDAAAEESETYDATGQLKEIRTRDGVVLTLAYDSNSRLLSVTDSWGHAITFQYEPGGGLEPRNRIARVVDPAGGIHEYQYLASGALEKVIYPNATSRTYTYLGGESAYLLTGIKDENNIQIGTYGYDGEGRATSTQGAGGLNQHTLTHTVPSDLWAGSVSILDPLGVTRTYEYVANNGVARLASITQPAASGAGTVTESYSYDTRGNLLRKKDFNGNSTCFEYDSGRNLETYRVEGFAPGVSSCPASLAAYTPTPGTRERKIATVWHLSYRLPMSISEANRTTSFTRDSSGRPTTRTVTDTSVTPNVARTWTYTYNVFGKVLTENGPRTDVTDLTTYVYYTCTTGYQCGQVNTITNALGHVTTYNSYNAHGRPTQITDANGLVTALAYDSRQRLTDRCIGGTLPGCAGGELTHLDYWPTGLLKKVTNPDSSFIEYVYDNAHRLVEIKDGALNKIVYTLDTVGNRTAENTYDPSSALKRTHTRVYNSLNQLWKDVNAAGTAAVTTVFGYDDIGNQKTVNAPLGRNSTSLYDELSRLQQITDPASGNTLFGYDANDNLTTVTDPRSLVTSYTYTGFGDLKTQVSPDTGTTTNVYDSGGNLFTSTDARSAITTYAYDALNRVTSAAFKIGSTTDQTITYTYDGGANQKGRLTGASDSRHTMSWSYDAKGRITGKTQVFTASTPNVSLTVGYGYNAAGQPTTLTLPSGRVIQYTFNANGQVASVVLVGSPNTTILNNITYDPFGPITGWTWGNATIASRTFDADGKITQVTSAGQRTFGYDDAFRINAATVVGDASNSWALGYDILDRLNSATKPTVTIGYTYDANGNRLTQTGTSASTYTVSGTSNKLSSTTGVLARTYSYDAVGNTQNSGATAHAYNNRGRMKTARLTSTSTNTNYDYDALGQRYRKGGGTPGTIYFMYDEAGHLLGEYNSTGALIQETVWLGDIPVATIRPKTGGVDVFYVHSDQLNTPRKVTRPNDNALRWRWDPTPFGEGAPDENPASLGQFKYHLRFPGQYFDMETNLNYNYFRDYDPAVARYVQSDRIGLRGGINTYGYGFANPLRFADPRGLVPGAGPGVAPPAWHPPRPIPGPIRALGRAGSRALWWLSAVVTAYEIYEMCKEEDQECDAILEEEINSCYEQYEDLGSGADWMRNACIARAKERWGACNRNGGTMPPGAPPPWGDQDVDGWGR